MVNQLEPRKEHKSSIKLPVLEALLKKIDPNETKKILEKTLIYYVHHPLQTSINVIDSLIYLGAKYENIFILGKRYSQNDEVVHSLIERGVHYQVCSEQVKVGQYHVSFIRDVNWLWFRLLEYLTPDVENILIMDHGGRAIQYAPAELLENHKIIGIEKTASGFFEEHKQGKPLFPIVDVANSLAKRYFESPLIAKAVVKKLFTTLSDLQPDHLYGVIGLGSIGNAIVNQLADMGYQLIIYDVQEDLLNSFEGKNSRIICGKNTANVITEADWIFGCSGRDITENMLEHFLLSRRNKVLVSCSSEDKEFLSLLHHIEYENPQVFRPFDSIKFNSKFNAEIKLLRGGFPINFDHSGESVPPNEIQLTRSLVIGAVLQAVELLKENNKLSPGIYPLNIKTQQFIVSEWLKYNADPFFHSLLDFII